MTTKLIDMHGQIVSKNGTVLTETEIHYRAKLISDSMSMYCPITHEVLVVTQGEIIYVNGQDYFVSDNGIDKLQSIFGVDIIKDRIITYD